MAARNADCLHYFKTESLQIKVVEKVVILGPDDHNSHVSASFNMSGITKSGLHMFSIS